MLAGILTATSLLFLSVGRALAADFPPFIPEPERLPAEIREEIVGVWTRYTLARTVSGQPARAPLPLYQLFVDTPEVTAAAARHLGLVKYQVRQLGADHYEAEDGEGAKGTYRVIVRDPQRRVMLTWGGHSGPVLGWIRGASLTVLTFQPETGDEGVRQIAQRVEAFVRIDNPLAAFFARVLLPLFKGYADRKIAEGFNITARVSEWAYTEPVAFCDWLGSLDGVPARREAFTAILPSCR
jgi:hypothetical protein